MLVTLNTSVCTAIKTSICNVIGHRNTLGNLRKAKKASKPKLIVDGLTENGEALLFDKPLFSVVFGSRRCRPLQANSDLSVLPDFSSIKARMLHYYV